MPTVPKLNGSGMEDQPMGLGDMTPGASQILQAAAVMHGYGRLLSDSSGAHSPALGAGGGVSRGPRRGKRFSQRSR